MSGPRVCSRVEASFYRWRKQYRQRACRWLAQSMPMRAAKPPLIDAVVFVVFILV